MAEVSFPFENVDTSESQFGQWASAVAGSEGVNGVPGDTNLLVSGDDSGLQVRVAAGTAVVRGTFYQNTIQATVPIVSAGTQTRIDAIVLELDLGANSTLLRAVQGTPVVSNPVAPTLTQTAGLYQMLLAYVTIPNNTTSITAGMVSDRRTFMGQRVGVWTTATRPTTGLLPNITLGYNTTLGYHEVWNGTAWRIFSGNVWTTATRPSSPTVGLTGYNTTLLSLESWNGTAWVAAGGSDVSPFLLMGA